MTSFPPNEEQNTLKGIFDCCYNTDPSVLLRDGCVVNGVVLNLNSELRSKFSDLSQESESITMDCFADPIDEVERNKMRLFYYLCTKIDFDGSRSIEEAEFIGFFIKEALKKTVTAEQKKKFIVEGAFTPKKLLLATREIFLENIAELMASFDEFSTKCISGEIKPDLSPAFIEAYKAWKIAKK